MLRQFITMFALFTLLIFTPVYATAGGIDTSESNLSANEIPVLSNVPSLKAAFARVTDTLSPNPILIVDYKLDLSLGSDESWRIHVVYYDVDINELQQKHFL